MLYYRNKTDRPNKKGNRQKQTQTNKQTKTINRQTLVEEHPDEAKKG